MNIDIQEYLDRADGYLAGKNKVLIISVAAILVLVLCWLAILPICEDLKNVSAGSLDQTRRELNSKADPAELRTTIARQEKEISANRNRINQLDAEERLYVDQINKFADDFFGHGDVNTYINTIAQKAALNRVNILQIDNNTANMPVRMLSPMYDINLTFTAARFEPLIRYLYDLESTNEISDVKYLNISGITGEISGVINIVTWGFKK